MRFALPSFAVLSALALAGASLGQVRFPGEPQGQKYTLSNSIPTFDIPAPDVNLLKHEDLRPHTGPLRYGVVIPTFIDMVSDGAYEVTADDRVVFRVKITSAEAYSLGLEFSKFDLPPGGQLFLYDDSFQNTFGSYEAVNVIPETGEFVIEPFPGSSVIVEYSQPLSAMKLGQIEIRSAIYDYMNVFDMERSLEQLEQMSGPQLKGSCALVDVNCPDGNPYPNQKRATMRTLYGGGLCSASLINNVLSDGTRYVYTANHCGQGTTTVFRFNYQTSGCATGSAPANQQVSGCAVLASDVDTDGRLLRISNAIPTNYNPYFAGWSRSTSNLTFGMSMHHPGGGVKKISIDNNGGGQTTGNFQGIGSVKVWSMTFNVGATEGGSSGGPLFDQNNRIRGALTGGPGSPCNVSLYGRFYNFFNEASIGQWLDPNTTNVTAIDGFDPITPPTPPTISTVNPTSVQAFGPGIVTLTGTGFTGATAVTVNGVALAPFSGFQVASDTQLTFTPPAPTALGSVNVTVTNSAGTSAAKQITYTETQPLGLVGTPLIINGLPLSFAWGGKANQITFFNFSNTNTTTTFNGQPFLLYLATIPWVNTDSMGLGSISTTITGVPAGLIIYSQVMTVSPPGTNPSTVQLSNIVSSQVIG